MWFYRAHLQSCCDLIGWIGDPLINGRGPEYTFPPRHYGKDSLCQCIALYTLDFTYVSQLYVLA